MEENGVNLQEKHDKNAAAVSTIDVAEADRLRALEEKKARQEAAAKAKKRKIRRKRIVTPSDCIAGHRRHCLWHVSSAP